jgi:hypothetical protein
MIGAIHFDRGTHFDFSIVFALLIEGEPCERKQTP